MARQETILSVFVASPSDLDEERIRLEEVIRELNTAWARHLGIRLELLQWETDAYPSFGEDPQAVINEQIPDDYDLFIGLMWYRFGTPTGRAGSGTVEEFQRAKKRFDSDPSSLQLMLYFKDAPVAPSKLDPSQLAKINEFRSTLGEEGGLYWSFNSVDDFENLIRLHLIRHVQSFPSKQSTVTLLPPPPESSTETEEIRDTEPTVPEDEPGFLDLVEQFEDEFEVVNEICERITAATVEIGEKMEARTAENKQFASGPDSANRKAAKRLIAKAAADMDQYVHRMEAEVPLFSHNLNLGMNTLIQIAAVAVDFKFEDDVLGQIKESLVAIRGFREATTAVGGSLTDFRESVASLPRMTTRLNRSKRAMVNVLQRLIDELHAAQVMAGEAEASFSSILEQN